MSQLLTPVEFFFVAPNGVPVKNTSVSIQLAKGSFDAAVPGVIMPREIFGVTDEFGKVVVPLQPSETVYYVTVEDSESLAALNYKFYVPAVTNANDIVRLQDIIVDADVGNISYDEAVLIAIQTAKAEAQVHRQAAEQAQVAAESARDAALLTLPVASATPPALPFPNQEWINTTNGKRYVWYVTSEGVPGVWAEIFASLVISSPEGTSPGTGSGGSFDPTSLPTISNLTLPVNAQIVVTEDGVAKRLQVSSEVLQTAGVLSESDVLIVKQLDGVERYTSLGALIAFLASRL